MNDAKNYYTNKENGVKFDISVRLHSTEATVNTLIMRRLSLNVYSLMME